MIDPDRVEGMAHLLGERVRLERGFVWEGLLGNIGRPGGGIMALRGHASIQGSTDIPTLFDILPGYIPMPHAHQALDAFVELNSAPSGYWGNMEAYTVSLLKAWYGDKATAENDYCFDYLPRLTGDHSIYPSERGPCSAVTSEARSIADLA